VTVHAVVVTHASDATLGPLTRSFAEHESGAGLVVVDSGSPDGAPAVEPPARTIALDANVGFGAACNEGAATALEDPSTTYVAFLNPDVRLTGPALSELAREMARRPDVGIATGPIVDQQGDRQSSAWGPTSALRAFWFATGWQLPRLRRLVGRVRGRGALTSAASLARDEIDVDGHVLGGAMVVRRECWEQLGGFDEDFFLYWEDADLCQRARDLGWKVAVLPCTPIVHVAGTSSAGVTDTQRWQWYVDGATRYAAKHLTRRQGRRLRFALGLGRRFRRSPS
jgi:N-acetylglucosaminyl-diphospho-decaprenol L-rhamnosyltransferase